MKERLNVEFKVDLDEILDEPRLTDTPLEELKEKNERQRKRLENIGEVNPTAIEAFTEMKKRYDFILEQKRPGNGTGKPDANHPGSGSHRQPAVP